MHKRILSATAMLLVILSMVSCGGRKAVAKLDAEDTFARGLEYFNNKKYVDAIDDFKEIVYNYSGTRVAAEASFYLGECYLLTRDYETAIDEYRHLTSDYPSSSVAEKGLYRMAYAYYKMSPNYALDQNETAEKAKSTVQLYFEKYPDGQSREDCQKLLLQINEKLAHKDYESGLIYFKMKQYAPAKIYFQGVVKDYQDTPWAGKAEKMLQQIEPLLIKTIPAKPETVSDSTKIEGIK